MAYFPPNDLTASGTINTQNLNATGTATAGSAVAITNLNGQAVLDILINTNTLNQSLIIQGTIDGTNWTQPLSLFNIGTGAINTTFISAGTTGAWQISCTGFAQIRVVEQSAVTGSATLVIRATYGETNSVNIQSVGGIVGQTGAASSIPVALATEDVSDVFVTGQSGQSSTVNNILTAVAGSSATDTMPASGVAYKTAYVQIVGTGTTSGGTVIFEGSNDNVTFYTMRVYQLNAGVAYPLMLSTGITASTLPYNVAINIPCRYLRCRINNAITGGGSIQAFTRYSQNVFIPEIYNPALTGAAASQSLPVSLAADNACDQYITGAAAQSVINTNLFLSSSLTSSLDTLTPATTTGGGGFGTVKSYSCQINGSAGISAGQVSFEGSNDNTTFVALTVYDDASPTVPIVAPLSIAASTQRFFSGKSQYRYIRCRISTAFTGGTVQAFSKFSNVDFVPRVTTVAQATAANLNVTASIAAAQTLATVTTVSTLSNTTQLTPGTAAANLGKAEDAASASGDTGVFILGVRRDAPVVSASANGDYQETAYNKWGAALDAPLATSAKTYSCSATVTSAASATDIAILPGNATNTVYVTKVVVSGVQTTGGSGLVQLIKRSAANSGGTSAGMTAVPHDAADAAAVSAPLSYTANPTPGAAVGTIRAQQINIGSATVVSSIAEWNFGDKTKWVTLSGVAQGLAINLNGVTFTGGSFSVYYEWFEI